MKGFTEAELATDVAANADVQLRYRHVPGLLRGLVRSVATAVKEFVAVRDRRLDEHERRLAELERGRLTYMGVWSEQQQYDPGQFVTCAGSVWHCNLPTRSRPGSPGGSWTLAVKAGRDAPGR